MYVSFEYCTQTLQAFKDLLVDDFKTNTFSLCGGLLHSQCVLIVQACRVSVLTRSTLSGLDHFLNCFQLFFARVYLLDSFLRVMIFSNDHNYLSCGTLIFGRIVVISCANVVTELFYITRKC